MAVSSWEQSLAVSLLGGPEWVEDPSRSSRIGAVNVVSTIVTTGHSSCATVISDDETSLR